MDPNQKKNLRVGFSHVAILQPLTARLPGAFRSKGKGQKQVALAFY